MLEMMVIAVTRQAAATPAAKAMIPGRRQMARLAGPGRSSPGGTGSAAGMPVGAPHQRQN